jgi:hypothetical protein
VLSDDAAIERGEALSMRRTYRTLAIIAGLALVASTVYPLFLQGKITDLIFNYLVGNLRVKISIPIIVLMRLISNALALTSASLVIVALTLAATVAAWQRRKGWLITFISTGLLSIYWSSVLYIPFYNLFPGKASIYQFVWFQNALFWLPAVMPVIATSLALVFALRGARRAEPARESPAA